MTCDIAFVGGGVMATTILSSMGTSGDWYLGNIAVADPSAEARDRLSKSLGVTVHESPGDLPEAGAYLLCVKPQDMAQACASLASYGDLGDKPVISIAAGVGTGAIGKMLGATKVVRTMPNTPLLVGHGFVFAHCPNGAAGPEAKLAEKVFLPMGQFHWLSDEGLMDAATALSGSGPAYVYLVIETMAKAAVEMGIDPVIAQEATMATLTGACEMVKRSDESPATLRDRVTSKGGTTEAALKVLSDEGFADILAKAMGAAKARSQEMTS